MQSKNRFIIMLFSHSNFTRCIIDLHCSLGLIDDVYNRYKNNIQNVISPVNWILYTYLMSLFTVSIPSVRLGTDIKLLLLLLLLPISIYESY